MLESCINKLQRNEISNDICKFSDDKNHYEYEG